MILIWIVATSTEICTNKNFTFIYIKSLLIIITPSYTSKKIFKVNFDGKGEVLRFSVINFQGNFIRQLSCYTLLSSYQLPWPLCCCLYEITPFMVSDKRLYMTLFPSTNGSSHIACPAYQNTAHLELNILIKCLN